jgi:phosphoribosylpyrophosphate synthetase
MSKYSDGDFSLLTKKSIRGYVYLLFVLPFKFRQSDGMLLMIDAAKRASARHITAVIPYGWAREDRKTSLEFR